MSDIEQSKVCSKETTTGGGKGKRRTEPDANDHSPAAVSHRAWKRRQEMRAKLVDAEAIARPRATAARRRLAALATETEADQLKAQRKELKRRYGKRKG